MSQSSRQVDNISYGAIDRMSELENRYARVVEALRELKDLLDQYSPAWYTEAQFEKASAALNLGPRAMDLPCEPDRHFRDSLRS